MAQKRSGKYRHIYGEPAKPDKQFLNLKNPLTSGEGQYVKANCKFFAVSKSGGGGPIYITRHDKQGRYAASVPMLSVHKGKCWDMDFHPFIDNMIATAADDCRACVTQFPAEGLIETISTPTVSLEGHQKKVTLCTFNPSANGILGTASFDRTIKVWDIESSACVSTYDDFKDTVYSMQWNHDGSQIATTSKDKKLRLYDPRAIEAAQTADSFEGSKSSKVFWVPSLNWVGATGFNRSAKRQLRLWDLRSLDKPIYSDTIDQASSVLVPTFDSDTGVLYLMGKGEGSVQYGEIINDDRKWYALGLYRNPEPQKGGGFLPKKALNVWKCEVMRFLKLTKNSVIPVSFIVPRKAGADIFQEDIYPDAAAGKPALTSEEWLGGANKDPVTMNLNPAKRSDEDSGGAAFVKKATYVELEAENKELKERVKTLEAQVAELGGTVDDPYENESKENDEEEAEAEAES